MSDQTHFQPIRNFIEGCWPGEWGTDPIGDQSNCNVYRATDIDDEGHLSLAAGAARVVTPAKLTSKALRKGDLLLEAAGGAPDRPVGRVALVDSHPSKPSLTSNFFRFMRPRANVDPSFLTFQLVALNRSSEIWRYQQQTTGLINLKVHDYLSHPIWMPALPTQRKIATILSTIDTAIEQTEALIEKYQHIKAGLMHDLFTRGVLSNGQLRPPREQAPELYQETAIGWISNDWIFTTCDVVCEQIIDCKNRTPPETPDGYPVIRTPNVRHGEFVDNELLFTDAHSYAIWTARGKPKVGDVVITREAPVGEVCMIPERHPEACLGQRMMLYRPNKNLIDPDFFLFALQSRQIQNRLDLISGGSTVGHVRVGDIRSLWMFMPKAKHEQHEIAKTLGQATERIRSEQARRNKLQIQKLGLMQDLLTGKVPVKFDSSDNSDHV